MELMLTEKLSKSPKHFSFHYKKGRKADLYFIRSKEG